MSNNSCFLFPACTTSLPSPALLPTRTPIHTNTLTNTETNTYTSNSSSLSHSHWSGRTLDPWEQSKSYISHMKDHEMSTPNIFEDNPRDKRLITLTLHSPNTHNVYIHYCKTCIGKSLNSIEWIKSFIAMLLFLHKDLTTYLFYFISCWFIHSFCDAFLYYMISCCCKL